MKMSFRWYGPSDPISLQDIRQIPVVKGIVSSCFEVAADQVIPLEKLLDLKTRIESHGMSFAALESIPVHEEIKLGGHRRDEYISIWIESLRNAASAGIEVVCYNFMLAFDWLRTDLRKPMEDRSHTMFFDQNDLDKFDFTREIPAWSQKYTPQTLAAMLKASQALTKDKFWENLAYFIQKVAPVAEDIGVKLAIHPDDPPYDIMGISRIITDKENLERFLGLYDSPANGLAFCTGSLGAGVHNNIEDMVSHFAKLKKINFMHIRNLRHESPSRFYETAHPTEAGELDMRRIIKALADNNYTGPARPDHGRDIWGEERTPGYGLYDRALGAAYLQGLWEASVTPSRGKG